jgi:hypothetical protein
MSASSQQEEAEQIDEAFGAQQNQLTEVWEKTSVNGK